MMTATKLYKAEEIAEMLQLNVQTVRRFGREGKLKTYKVGRAVRFYPPIESEEKK